MHTKRLAIIAGIGEGFGVALAEKLIAENYGVIGLARTDTLQSRFSEQIARHNFHLVLCDLYSENSIEKAFEQILILAEHHQARIVAYIHNASQLVIEEALETTLEDFENVWRLTAFSAFKFSQLLLPEMLKSQHGQIIFTGATASIKGSANFAAFASAKFALRGLSQSLAREYGPKGIHVVHTILDGIIDCEWTRKMFQMPKDETMLPKDLAEVYWQILKQPQSTWTQELDLRPYCESF